MSTNQTPAPSSLPFGHGLLSRYYRRAEHPGRLRILNTLTALLARPCIHSEIRPGVVMALDPDDYVQREILFHGGYELPTLERFDSLLLEARGFTDFGAHMGLYTLRAARALLPRDGRVFAIEPTIPNAHALLRNAHLSGLQNIELCCAAFSDQGGLLRMITPHFNNTGGSRLGNPHNLASDQRAIALHVAVRPAAELVPLIPEACLDLVKLDVEGQEFRILRSLFAATPIRPRNLIVEYLPGICENDTVDQLAHELAWLKSEGYELLNVHGVPYRAEVELPDSNLWLRRRAS